MTQPSFNMYGSGSRSFEDLGLDIFGSCNVLENTGEPKQQSGESSASNSGGGAIKPTTAGNGNMTSSGNMTGGPSTSGSGSFRYPSEVSKVAVRVPPFWRDDPELWFQQVEYQFVLAGITTDVTKFNVVAGQLENEYAKVVKDVVMNPPAQGKYDKLKAELIRRLSFSTEQKTLQLIQHEELGDRKPSQFLRHLQSLAGSDVPSDFIRTIWTSRLPANIQVIAASQPRMPLEEVAELADRVHDIVRPGLHVAYASAVPPYAPQRTSGTSLESKVTELTRMVEELYRKQNEPRAQNRGRHRSRSQSRNRQRSRSRSYPNQHPHCWYHFTFGDKANKCTQPCSFQSGKAHGSH